MQEGLNMRWIVFVLAFAAQGVGATEVGGIRFAPQAEPGLVLNGAGLRKLAFFNIYAMGLYVPQKKSTAIELLAQEGPKRIAIHMLRDVSAEQFTEALVDGMKENHAEAEYRGLEPRVKQLAAIMAQLKEAKKGMLVALDWSTSGTSITIDGKPAGAPIPGEDFFRALLRIWLGESPVSADLKKALLGAD